MSGKNTNKNRKYSGGRRSAGRRSSRPVRYRHRRKGYFTDNILYGLRGFKKKVKRKLKKWWKEQRPRFIVSVAGLILILILVIAHGLYGGSERISTDGFTHDSRFSNYLILNGIDVSYAQGDIDWKAVKKSGVDYVIIRAGYTGGNTGKRNVDEYFASNIKEAEDAGLMTGIYWFSQATTTDEAKAEANELVKLAKDYEVDLPLVMDYELLDGGRLSEAFSSGSLTASGATDCALAFCQTVEKAGYDSMVYGNSSFLQSNLDPVTIGENTHVWMAQYATSASYSYLYSMWQASNTEKVSGITRNVDRDFWYVDTGSGYNAYGADSSRKSMSKCTVEIKNSSTTYMGFKVEPKVSVYDGRKELEEGKDYYLSYVQNTGPGTGYAVVTGMRDYKDMAFASFKIKGI
ncbi:glycoside hydrolase family 25 protein [Mobilibacterium timonense]|uniref:glycoside hydrolase family 25 protein n=1 Tax=Mobilibacterium timonense TaxID=1871012 RepID=UPI0009849282|nr:glycoside hydrolase family 25 protein [Mobilibacterium timonense]